ncbi:alpha/beta hydrolase family esterase [Flexivirga caeni]|uniref:Esterase n=1 Tax=Flexivirga caeni TaxID=2294115 RepID=A0A3M9LVK0_9MICO|nr:PHB depolymerase family esterase [Flexivirga caeni]RNI17262.1 esterase [Flexivirga caeni]
MASDPMRKRRAVAGGAVLVVVLAVVALMVVRSTGSIAPIAGSISHPASMTPIATRPAAADDRTLSTRVDGHVRTLILHTPPQAARGTALPLVLVYHGALATASGTESSTDFDRIANAHGFLVAFLQGYQDTWNEGAGHTPAERAGINDVAFTKAALAVIERTSNVDRSRVVATGFSNGALLTDLLGCRLAGVLRAIVPVSGPLPVTVSASCAPAAPISVLEVHGTNDTAIPYDGGHFVGVGGGTTVLSAPAAVARWASLDGCRSVPNSTAAQPGVRITTYSGCRDDVSVSLRTLVGGGHSWPADIGTLVDDLPMMHS